MSRFRASIAPSEEDRLIAQHMSVASREIEAALRVARGAPRETGYRKRRMVKDLVNLLEGVNSVLTIGAPSGADPDLMPEEERIRLHREKMAEERSAREALRREEVISGK